MYKWNQGWGPQMSMQNNWSQTAPTGDLETEEQLAEKRRASQSAVPGNPQDVGGYGVAHSPDKPPPASTGIQWRPAGRQGAMTQAAQQRPMTGTGVTGPAQPTSGWLGSMATPQTYKYNGNPGEAMQFASAAGLANITGPNGAINDQPPQGVMSPGAQMGLGAANAAESKFSGGATSFFKQQLGNLGSMADDLLTDSYTNEYGGNGQATTKSAIKGQYVNADGSLKNEELYKSQGYEWNGWTWLKKIEKLGPNAHYDEKEYNTILALNQAGWRMLPDGSFYNLNTKQWASKLPGGEWLGGLHGY